jgi:predicted nucleic acid-binding protein
MNVAVLAKAVAALLPGTVIARQRAYSWHSRTSSGQQVVLDLRTSASAKEIATFTQMLPDHEFSIQDSLVADIYLAAQHGDTLTVEALLLE